MVESALTSSSATTSLLGVIVFLPALGALFNGLTGRRLRSNRVVDIAALGTVGLSFLLSVVLLVQLLGRAPVDRALTQDLWTWLELGGARVLGGLTANTLAWGYRFDALSAAMGEQFGRIQAEAIAELAARQRID